MSPAEGDNVAAEEIVGGEGNDVLVGDAGENRLIGGFGDDIVRGGDGNDKITGGEGLDQLFGDAGDDVLEAQDIAAGNNPSHPPDPFLSCGEGTDHVWLDKGDTRPGDCETFNIYGF